jgi:hypothetical protein
MVRTANEYINCDTFWLHRPEDGPYQKSDAFVFRVLTTNPVIYSKPDDSSTSIGTAIAGELFDSPQALNDWTQITLQTGGNGWVHSVSGSGTRVTNDQSINKNCGLFGGNGVAYSFGGKDLPRVFTNQMITNANAPPADGPGNLRRIANWEEYQRQHQTGTDAPNGPGCVIVNGPLSGNKVYLGKVYIWT